MKRITALGMTLLALAAACSATRENQAVATGGQNQVAKGDGNVIATGDDPESGDDDGDWGIIGDPSYPRVVSKVVGMVNDSDVRAGAQRRGLDVLNVMWDDTGRA